MPEGACNCAGDKLDCNEICGGTGVKDVCGKCNGRGIQVGHCDC